MASLLQPHKLILILRTPLFITGSISQQQKGGLFEEILTGRGGVCYTYPFSLRVLMIVRLSSRDHLLSARKHLALEEFVLKVTLMPVKKP